MSPHSNSLDIAFVATIFELDWWDITITVFEMAGPLRLRAGIFGRFFRL